MNKLFLTFFYSGLLRPAPGTWGSFFGLILGVLIAYFLGITTLFLLAVLISLIAIKEVNVYEANGGEHDNSSIVIDEVIGIWITLSMGLAINLENGGEYIYVKDTSNSSDVCKEFRQHSIVQDLRKVNLAFN